MNTPERRDYGRRAETSRTALDRILSAAAAISPADLADVIPEPIAERILKRFAVRGFLRRCAEGWMPQPILFSPAPLERTEAA